MFIKKKNTERDQRESPISFLFILNGLKKKKKKKRPLYIIYNILSILHTTTREKEKTHTHTAE
jgi:hypothetical protein